MRFPRSIAFVLVLVTLLAASCSGGDDEDAAAPAETPAAATTAPAGPTRSEVKTAIFERSYSDCGSFTLARLAAKYKVARNPATVASAVARDWTQRFDGGEDAVQAGRDGCLQAMRESR